MTWLIKATRRGNATDTQTFVAMDGTAPCETRQQAVKRVADFNAYNEFWTYELVEHVTQEKESTVIRDWVKGWNWGLTGPNTPSTPTVGMACAVHDHNKAMDNWKQGQPFPKSPTWFDYYIPIACGTDTVAIAVGPDREATADFIVKACVMEQELAIAKERIAALERTLQSLKDVVVDRIEEVL